MAHLGQTIADLRQERNLSQAELAADILSPAQLSKAEHGLTDLSGTKLVMLLGRLHITPREFFSLAEIQTASETIEEQLISDTYTSLVKNDQQLGRQVIRQAEIFDQQAQTKFSHLSLIMARAQIGQLFEQKLSTADVHYMTDYLFSVEHWSRYELVLFMSTTSALSLAVVDQLAREVSHRSKRYQALNLDLVTNLLFNTEMTFIEARLPTKAKFFAAALKALTPGDDHMGAHFLITFGRISYQYCFEDRYQATLQIKKLLQALKILHMNDYYQFFDRSFKEFQQQYC